MDALPATTATQRASCEPSRAEHCEVTGKGWGGVGVARGGACRSPRAVGVGGSSQQRAGPSQPFTEGESEEQPTALQGRSSLSPTRPRLACSPRSAAMAKHGVPSLARALRSRSEAGGGRGWRRGPAGGAPVHLADTDRRL